MFSLSYEISVKACDFRKFIENDYIDTTSKHVQYIKGTKWIQVIEPRVQLHEKNHYRLRVVKTRLLWLGEKFLILTAACKVCRVLMTFTMKNRPAKNEEEFTFVVNRTNEHDEVMHKAHKGRMHGNALTKSTMVFSASTLKKCHDEQISMGLIRESTKHAVQDYVKQLLKKEIVLNNLENGEDDQIDQMELMDMIFCNEKKKVGVAPTNCSSNYSRCGRNDNYEMKPSKMQTYVLKIRQGQDLNKELNEFVRVNDLKAAFVMSCVGGLSRASLRIGHMLIKSQIYEEPMEIISMSGTLSCTGGPNLRISLSRQNGSIIGGQVGGELNVSSTAEIVIGQCDDYVFNREFSTQTGNNELEVKLKQ